MATLFGDQHLFWIKDRLGKCNVESLAVYQNLLITLMMKIMYIAITIATSLTT